MGLWTHINNYITANLEYSELYITSFCIAQYLKKSVFQFLKRALSIGTLKTRKQKDDEVDTFFHRCINIVTVSISINDYIFSGEVTSRTPLRLTRKNNTFMAGFPTKALSEWQRVLVEAGFQLAICDQTPNTKYVSHCGHLHLSVRTICYDY